MTEVLVVSEVSASRGAVGGVLSRAGYFVIDAKSGPEALELAAWRRPGVVILHAWLSAPSTFEICRRLKADPATSRIAVIQSSPSMVAPDARARAFEAGADALLAQPLDPAELVATTAAMLRIQRRWATDAQRIRELEDEERRTRANIAELTHELRNPLSAIAVAASLTQEAHEPSDRAHRLAATIARHARHLAAIIDRLDAADPQEHESETAVLVDVRAVVDEVVQRHVVRVDERDCAICVARPDDAVVVEARPASLRELVDRMVRAAVRSCLPRSPIAIHLAIEDGPGARRDAALTVRSWRSGIGRELQHSLVVRRLVNELHAQLGASEDGDEACIRVPIASSTSGRGAPPPAEG